eukprot:ctg_302.g133
MRRSQRRLGILSGLTALPPPPPPPRHVQSTEATSLTLPLRGFSGERPRRKRATPRDEDGNVVTACQHCGRHPSKTPLMRVGPKGLKNEQDGIGEREAASRRCRGERARQHTNRSHDDDRRGGTHRICNSCGLYFRKYGGKWYIDAPGISTRSGSALHRQLTVSDVGVSRPPRHLTLSLRSSATDHLYGYPDRAGASTAARQSGTRSLKERAGMGDGYALAMQPDVKVPPTSVRSFGGPQHAQHKHAASKAADHPPNSQRGTDERPTALEQPAQCRSLQGAAGHCRPERRHGSAPIGGVHLLQSALPGVILKLAQGTQMRNAVLLAHLFDDVDVGAAERWRALSMTPRRHHQPAARPQHPRALAHKRQLVGHVFGALQTPHHVESAVGVW